MLPEFQTELIRKGSGVLYSTILFAAGTALANTNFLFYSYAQGAQPLGFAAGVVAGNCETNLRGTAGQIPGQLAFMADGISLNYSNFTARAPVSSADLHNLIDNGVMLLWYYQDTDTIVIAPSAQVPGGAGLQGVAGTNGAQASEISTGPGMLRFPKPVPINPLQTFGIRIQFPASSSAVVVSTAVRCTLYGTYQTAIAQG